MLTPPEPGFRLPDNSEQAAVLRGRLARVESGREQVAKAWLADLILHSPLAEVERMPMGWATTELPELISDILAAVGEGGSPPHLTRRGSERASQLAELRRDATPGRMSHELSYLQEAILGALRHELLPGDPDLFGEAAGRLAAVFGLVGGVAADSMFERSEAGRDPLTGLGRPAQMQTRLTQLLAANARYGHPFAVVLLDAEGPGTREKPEVGKDSVLLIVAAALRDSIRVIDEGYRLDDDELCVLAPEQGSDEAVRMGERLAAMLSQLEASGGLRITISAGVVSCPEHGNDTETLLRRADTAMWRARATGRPVAVGSVQDRLQAP